ncbi:matrixin family metalloprotease [Methanosarcina lacustris]|uniref:matrixin family metalloprotease n=1 Tax=Methanosarcina lacustris TaxID=170861 RepID=UPI00064F6373|nr:matrixin family metalloprotease [Methanosarcina lacustris]
MKCSKKLLIGTLLLTALLVNMASPASAYQYNGRYWHQGYAQYTKDSSIPSSWSTPLASAANTWNNAGTNFFFYQISCNNKLYYKLLGDISILAVTHEVYSGDSMLSCTVDFNKDFGALWSTSGEQYHYDVQNVATHEFGHWLSLGDLYTSADTEKTMYYTISLGETKKRTLHSDDIAGIQSIY